jgi:uncharacterized protein
MMPFYSMFDPMYWIIVGPAMLIAVWASFKVKSAFGKWSKVGVSSRMTGAEAAARVLQSEGLSDVKIEETTGFLSDHYDPRTKVLHLSPQVYRVPSVAAVGVACHEAGHALQDATHYAPLKFRNAVVPTASIGSWLAFPMIFLGFMLHFKGLVLLGVLAFSVLVVFQLVTLPVEFNASKRAKSVLFNLGLVQVQEEADGVAAVLDAAAMTYVAATITALAQLLYFLMRLGVLGNRRN